MAGLEAPKFQGQGRMAQAKHKITGFCLLFAGDFSL
jgi:hypothetical protein